MNFHKSRIERNFMFPKWIENDGSSELTTVLTVNLLHKQYITIKSTCIIVIFIPSKLSTT